MNFPTQFILGILINHEIRIPINRFKGFFVAQLDDEPNPYMGNGWKPLNIHPLKKPGCLGVQVFYRFYTPEN